MNNVTIHIGYPKSASTFIQEGILRKSKDVVPFGIHDNFAGSFVYKDDYTLSKSEKAELQNKVLTKFSDQNLPMILSNEAISMGQWRPSYDFVLPTENICESLVNTFPSAKILIILRPQYGWISSWWKETVRGLGQMSIKTPSQTMQTEFFRKKILPKLCYDSVLQMYQDAFGTKNVHVMFYNDIENNPDTFVQELCDLVGIPVPDWESIPRNKSESDLLNVCLLKLNKVYYKKRGSSILKKLNPNKVDDVFFQFKKNYFRKLDIILKHFSKQSSSLLLEEKENINNLFKNSNQKLASLLGQDITAKGFVL